MKMVHVITGDTYGCRDRLKSLGFKWDTPLRVWWRYWDMDRGPEEIHEALGKLPGIISNDFDADVMRNALAGKREWLDEQLGRDFLGGGK